MAMNFSSCSLFPSNIRPADDDYASAMRHRASDGRWTPYWLGWEMDDLYDYGQEADSHIEGSHDPADFLPSDPFGMELSNTFSAAIAGWINDIGADPGDYEVGDDDLVADLSYYWNHALSSSSSAPRYSSECAFDCWLEGGEYPGYYGYGYGYDVCCKEEYSRSSGADAAHSAGGGSVPHEGILFALRYLGVQDLLSVELVCKSLRSAVQNDTLLWRCIHIDSPMGGRITDDDLLRLTQRAQRSLECLNLAKCSRITDEGLKHVLESNPRLKKLGVAECLRLTTEGLIRNLKIFNSSGSSRITHLKMGRHFSVSPEQYEELRSLIDGEELSRPPKRFFHTCLSSPPICADERAIDIELCRACQKFKLVFDCPSGCCQGKEDSELCRACDICIARCFECGRCITNRRYVETFLLDYLCGDCSGGPETQGEE